MKTKVGSRTATALVVVVGLYVAAYLFSTEIHHGRLGADRFRIRIFQTEMHRRMFVALSFLEGLLSPRDREFSTQVANHASLPPPE